MEPLVIYDSTLRDGEQCPRGGQIGVDQKMNIARALADLGVNIIEGGYAAANETDRKALNQMAREIAPTGPMIATIARCVPADIDAAAQALKPAIKIGKARIMTFIATSDLHLREKLQMSRSTVLDKIRSSVARVADTGADVAFGAEDASRSDLSFLTDCIHVAIEAGARTIDLPDTTGTWVATQAQAFFAEIRRRVQAPDFVIFATHCHNDKGLATANTLFALQGGARQVECCLNGFGERAGNAALEEIVMNVRLSPEVYPYETTIRPERLYTCCCLAACEMGIDLPYHKAFVGENAFTHTSGIHQDAWLKSHNPRIYSAVDANLIGRTNDVILTRHSGTKAISYQLRQLGLPDTPDMRKRVMRVLKQGDKINLTGADILGF